MRGSTSFWSVSRRTILRDLGAPPRVRGAEAIVAHNDSLYVANFNTGGMGSVSTFRLGLGPPGLLAAPTPTGGSEPDLGGIVVRDAHG